MDSFFQKNLQALSLTNIAGILSYFLVLTLKFGDNHYVWLMTGGAVLVLSPYFIAAISGIIFSKISHHLLYGSLLYLILLPILAVFFMDKEVNYFSAIGLALLLLTRWNHDRIERPLFVLNALGAAVWILMISILLFSS